MVQILPGVPTFSDKLTQVLSQAGVNIGEGFQKRSALENLMNYQSQFDGSQPAPASGNQPANGQSAGAGFANMTPQQAGTYHSLISRVHGKDAANAVLDFAATEQKAAQRAQENIRAENAKEIKEYADPYKDISKIKTQISSLKEASRLVKSGKVSFDDLPFRTAITAALEGDEKPISELSKTAEQQQFWSLIRPTINSKELGGSNPSTRELLIELSSKPQIFKRREANEYILDTMLSDAQTRLEKGEEINRLRKLSPFLNPAEFSSLVEEKIGPGLEQRHKKITSKYTARSAVGDKFAPKGSVWVLNTETGEYGHIPKDQLKDALSQGYEEL